METHIDWHVQNAKSFLVWNVHELTTSLSCLTISVSLSSNKANNSPETRTIERHETSLIFLGKYPKGNQNKSTFNKQLKYIINTL